VRERSVKERLARLEEQNKRCALMSYARRIPRVLSYSCQLMRSRKTWQRISVLVPIPELKPSPILRNMMPILGIIHRRLPSLEAAR